VILLSALVLGLLAGWWWGRRRKRPFRLPDLKSVWLVPAAFVPQLVVAYFPAKQHLLPDRLAAVALPVSLTIFLAFVWLNRGLAGMPILLVGLILNLVVIAANGGWMPISPETASHLAGGDAVLTEPAGSRFGQKDILLLPQDTRLAFLADRFLLPDWLHYRVAFSLGDILVAIGVFWLLASPQPMPDLQRSGT
jgi:hypothetical protein